MKIGDTERGSPMRLRDPPQPPTWQGAPAQRDRTRASRRCAAVAAEWAVRKLVRSRRALPRPRFETIAETSRRRARPRSIIRGEPADLRSCCERSTGFGDGDDGHGRIVGRDRGRNRPRRRLACIPVPRWALEQLTEDHSLVADLVHSGRLTEQAEVHPQRSVITRASVRMRPSGRQLHRRCLRERRLPDLLGRALHDDRRGDGQKTIKKHRASRLPHASFRQPTSAEARTTSRSSSSSIEEGSAGARRQGSGHDSRHGRSGGALTRPVTQPPKPSPTARSLTSSRRAGRRAPRYSPSSPLRRSRRSRALGSLLAHVGSGTDGRVTIYQGVPWNLIGSVHLYREVYVSNLRDVQLTPEERSVLFNHDLVSEATAVARIARYEREAFPEPA